MTRYTERELWIPVLELLAEEPTGLTTAALIGYLTERMLPTGHDAEIIGGRSDSYFSQKVRNITSHRSLARSGLISYPGHGLPLEITEAGRAFLEQARRRGETTEAAYRERQWNQLGSRGGPRGVSTRILDALRIHRGDQPVWADPARTSQFPPEFAPLAVSIAFAGGLGSTFANGPLIVDGLGPDAIAAAERAAAAGLVIFFVSSAALDGTMSDVHRASVVAWDREAGSVELSFDMLGPEPQTVVAARAGTVATAYRRANERPSSAARDPFQVDPNAVDRALAAHARTQNQLASWVTGRGLTPLSSASKSLDFDLAWRDGDSFYVAEVKSLPRTSESRQLRLGLGQVLDYQSLLEGVEENVVPVLVTEREPHEPRWVELCHVHGVRLVWPGALDRIVVATE